MGGMESLLASMGSFTMPKTRYPEEDSFQFKKRPNAERFRKYGINPTAMEALARLQQQQNLYPENLERAKDHNEDWAYDLDEKLTQLTGYALQSQELCETAETLSRAEAQVEQYQKLSERLASLEKREKETFFRLTRTGTKKLLPWLAVAALLISFAAYTQLTKNDGNRTQNSPTDLPQADQQTRPTGKGDRKEAPAPDSRSETDQPQG